jgi:hypothetical protein
MTKENKELLTKLYLVHTKKQYPSFPEFAIPKEKFSDTTANELTKTICKFITYIGGQAERISNQGQYRDNSKIEIDVVGRARKIGSGKWTKGQGTNGTADISAIYKGISFKIEVKIGKDRMSEAQYKYKDSVERAGAVYLIAKDFDTFIVDFKRELQKKLNK